jgi:hypothetical protein
LNCIKVVLKKKISIVFFVFITSFCTYSQERVGICNSIYSGITGEWINPAYIAGTPFKWDFNLVTLHAYADNSYLYMYQANIPDVIADNGNTEIAVANAYNLEKNISSKFMIENRENHIWYNNVYVNALLQGPSLMVSVKKWAFAFSMSGRSAVSLIRFNKEGAKLLFEGLSYDPLWNKDIPFRKFRLNGAAWEEFGITVAREIKKDRKRLIKAGITIKHLKGIDAAYYLNRDMTLSVPNDSSMDFKSISADYGYAFSEDDWNSSKGRGKSIDLGITIEKKPLKNIYQCPYFCNKKLGLEYAWKLGISLIDIGYIRFKKNAAAYTVDNKSNLWINFDDVQLEDVPGFDSLMNSHFGDNYIPTPIGDKFTMMLPWALSVQYDYNIGYNFYINGTWVQRIPHFGAPGIDRADIISITPRFDHRRIGIALPIVLYQYVWPRIGLAVRLNNFLFVGTDKIGSLLGNKLSGADIYVGLKINVLKKCRKNKTKGFLSF